LLISSVNVEFNKNVDRNGQFVGSVVVCIVDAFVIVGGERRFACGARSVSAGGSGAPPAAPLDNNEHGNRNQHDQHDDKSIVKYHNIARGATTSD
jgi:hypothetical protein